MHFQNFGCPAGELLAAEFATPGAALPGLLPVGLTLLSGEAFAGKSWLALQLAAAVAAGGRVFGREVEPGRVLYLAADDGPRRLQERAARQGLPPEADISFATGWPGPPDAALADLERVIGEGEYRLIVLDTISALADSAEHATAFAATVRRAALTANAAALAVDRAALGRDILARVACDAALNLERAADGATGVLRVTGRDVEPQEIALAWQPVTCTWHLASEPGPARAGDRRKACHDASSPAAPLAGNGGGRKA